MICLIKKLFVLLPVLLLVGCVQKRTVTPQLYNISFTAEISYKDETFKSDIMIGEDALKFVVIEPQEIKDFTLEITKNGTTAEFKGLKHTSDANLLPQGAVAQILYDVLNDVANKNNVFKDDENCEIEGEVNGYEYSFVFSPSGLPLLLEVDDISLKIEFKNVTVN